MSRLLISLSNVAPTLPVDSNAAANTVSEGASNGTVVGITANAADIHGGSVTYTLTNDAGGRFQIDRNTGIVTIKNAALLNFEAASSHEIQVQATDGTTFTTQQFVVTVTNVAPTLPADSNAAVNTVSEGAVNGTVVNITAMAADIHGGTVTYSLSNDAGGRFQINPATGVVTVKDANLLNFEAAGSHTITVVATDGTNHSTQQFNVAITNVAPTASSDVNGSANAVSEAAVNGATVGITAVATDAHGGTLTYSLTNDAGGRFQIDSVTGVVTVKNANLLNYETATSHAIAVLVRTEPRLRRSSLRLLLLMPHLLNLPTLTMQSTPYRKGP